MPLLSSAAGSAASLESAAAEAGPAPGTGAGAPGSQGGVGNADTALEGATLKAALEATLKGTL